MVTISREPALAATGEYDMIVVGGGIYGAMLLLEACKQGIRTLLLERDDFGGATSFNSLRILHGGLRYLQKLDLPRFGESVRERRWFLRNFPELARSLPCLMPLYGKGMHRPAILNSALKLNDALSWSRNRSVRQDRHLAPGRVVSPETTKTLFPLVDSTGLKGGAVWYDACIPDSQRVVMEVLRWGVKLGATALNYVEVLELRTESGQVAGVLAQDKVNGESHTYSAPVVINATGPWSGITAQSFDRGFDQDKEPLFNPSIAWNILLDRPALSDHALAVMPKKAGAQTYFLHPWKGRILAGTGHSPWSGAIDNPLPSDQQITGFLQDINDAIPGLKLREEDIAYIFAGLLPAKDSTGAGLATREVILNHEESEGPLGLFSVSGVKFTTSRLVAEKTIHKVFARGGDRIRKGRIADVAPPNPQTGWNLRATDLAQHNSEHRWKPALANLIAQESVVHLDDLVLRRTTLWEDASGNTEIAPQLCSLFNWDKVRCSQELERLNTALRNGNNAQLNVNSPLGTRTA
jgi:glycerol-3-phosphate dehydrogenase